MTLYICYPLSWTQSQIVATFQKYGTVTAIAIGRDPAGAPRGFCFLDMPDEKEACNAIDRLDNVIVGDFRLAVKTAERTISYGCKIPADKEEYKRLCVRGIPLDVSEAELTEVFAEIGPVTDVRIIVDQESKKSRGFGFVEYADADHGIQAIDELDRSKWGDSLLKVAVAEAPKRVETKNDRPRYGRYKQ